MRLNGLAPSAYPIERAPQRGGAPVPYRESERAAEQAREEPACAVLGEARMCHVLPGGT